MTRIIGRTRIPIALAIVLLLSMGIAMPVTAEEMQAEDEVFSVGGYDLGLFPFDTEAGVSEGIDPEIAAMPYRLVNPDYVPEEFLILRTGGEFSAADVKADGELLEEQWEEICGKFVPNRYLGFGLPVLTGSDTLSAYGIAIRPDGVTEQYFDYGFQEKSGTGLVTKYVEEVPVGAVQSIETDALEWKADVSSELSGFTLASSMPYLIGTQNSIRRVDESNHYKENYGYIKLITKYYWDNQEQDDRMDYFFAKSELNLKPGDVNWQNGWKLDTFKLYQNWKRFSGSSQNYKSLPEVCMETQEPGTTTGYTNVQLSLSPASAILGWSTQIPDQKVLSDGDPAIEKAGWELIFNPDSECAKKYFVFTGASAVNCKQSTARNGNSYALCSATVNFKNGWSKSIYGVPYSRRNYGPGTGITSLGQNYVTRYSSSRFR